MTRNTSGDSASRGGSFTGQMRQVIADLLGCTELNLDELEETTRHAIGRARQLLTESTPRLTERGAAPTVRKLAATCRQVAESAENWADCSDLREAVAVFRELGQDCRSCPAGLSGACTVKRSIWPH